MSGKSTTIRFLISNTLSLLGNSIAAIVLPLVVLAITGDALAAGTLAIACAIPQVLAGVFGGVILDRFNRRNVSIVSDIISALCVAALPLVDMTIGLSFGWFVLFGILGAVGDIPGMTARDTLLPAVTKHDGVDMQRFMGIFQSLDSLTIIIGPALAALMMGFIGSVSALWITAALSFAAALVTLSLPVYIGKVGTSTDPEDISAITSQPDNARIVQPNDRDQGIVSSAFVSLREGCAVLFKKDGIITVAFLLSLGMVMVLGSFQGLVLPYYFTEIGHAELLGYVLSVISFGTLAGSLVYAGLAKKLKNRTWYVLSILGMAVGIAIIGSLPAYPLMLFGAFLLGALSGPISALLGYFILDRVPEERRGSVFGTQNSLFLVASPLAIFGSSILVSAFGAQITSWVLIGVWLLVTVYALLTKKMHGLDSTDQSETDNSLKQSSTE